MSRNTYILNAGHGIDTNGKRSTLSPTLFEFEFNRDIVTRIERLCNVNNIDAFVLCPEIIDIHWKERVARAEYVRSSKGHCIGLDIHANAGGGKGIEFYSDRNNTFSDVICNKALCIFKKNMPDEVMRGHKECNFNLIHNTSFPFILGETGFMDTVEGYNKLRSEEYRNNVALSYFKLIEWIEKYHLSA